jgi:tRNA(fMet)-specific endonuclease VapC
MELPVGERYAEVQVALEDAGTPIGGSDMPIAAHALALALTLVTSDEGEFRRVPGFAVENRRSG